MYILVIFSDHISTSKVSRRCSDLNQLVTNSVERERVKKSLLKTINLNESKREGKRRSFTSVFLMRILVPNTREAIYLGHGVPERCREQWINEWGAFLFYKERWRSFSLKSDVIKYPYSEEMFFERSNINVMFLSATVFGRYLVTTFSW